MSRQGIASTAAVAAVALLAAGCGGVSRPAARAAGSPSPAGVVVQTGGAPIGVGVGSHGGAITKGVGKPGAPITPAPVGGLGVSISTGTGGVPAPPAGKPWHPRHGWCVDATGSGDTGWFGGPLPVVPAGDAVILCATTKFRPVIFVVPVAGPAAAALEKATGRCQLPLPAVPLSLAGGTPMPVGATHYLYGYSGTGGARATWVTTGDPARVGPCGVFPPGPSTPVSGPAPTLAPSPAGHQ